MDFSSGGTGSIGLACGHICWTVAWLLEYKGRCDHCAQFLLVVPNYLRKEAECEPGSKLARTLLHSHRIHFCLHILILVSLDNEL